MICNIPDDKPWCYLHCGVLETGVEHFTLEDGKQKSTYYDKNGNMVQPSCRDYEGVPCIDKCNITGVYSYGGKVELSTKPELKTVHYIKREGETTECTIDITPEASDSNTDIMKGYLLLCLPCASNGCTDGVNVEKVLLDSSFKQISLCEYKLVDDPCPEVAQCKADDPWRIDIAKQSIPVEVKNVEGDCLKVDKCPDTAPWGVSLDAQTIDVAVKNAEGDCLNVAQCDGDVFEIQNPADGTPLDVNLVGNDVCVTVDNCEGKNLSVENPADGTPLTVDIAGKADGGTPLDVNISGNDVCLTVDNCDGKSLAVENPDDGTPLKVSIDGMSDGGEPVEVINNPGTCLDTAPCPDSIWTVEIQGDAGTPIGVQDVNITGNNVCLSVDKCANTPAWEVKVNGGESTPLPIINNAGECLNVEQCPDSVWNVKLVPDDTSGETGDCLGTPIKMDNKCVSTDDGVTFITAEHIRFFKADCTYTDVYFDNQGERVTGTIVLSETGTECC